MDCILFVFLAWQFWFGKCMNFTPGCSTKKPRVQSITLCSFQKTFVSPTPTKGVFPKSSTPLETSASRLHSFLHSFFIFFALWRGGGGNVG